MTLDDAIQLGKAYNGLGWAVQDQLDNVIDGEDVGDQNPNAMRLVVRFLDAAEQAGVDAQDVDDLRSLITEQVA